MLFLDTEHVITIKKKKITNTISIEWGQQFQVGGGGDPPPKYHPKGYPSLLVLQ